jgi:demethylmenaquinone methyltransferase / 2-methoxy-6-polyprenyl-1,4-benzoquinol methylase
MLGIKKSDSFQMFNEIYERYDLINSVLSFGLHKLWKRQLREKLPSGFTSMDVLDIATGTGDIALSLAADKRVKHVRGVDLSEGMLSVAQEKAAKSPLRSKLHFALGDAQKLNQPDRSFEAVVIAFGIRNFANVEQSLKECFRVLKPGGRLIILEFSLPQNMLWRHLHLFYLRRIVPLIGGLISGHPFAYRYLNQTIESFPYGKDFGALMETCGFRKVGFEPLTMGISTLYWAERT